MACRVDWQVSSLASHLYMAAAVGLNWPLVDRRGTDQLRLLADSLVSLGVTPSQLMRLAVPAAGVVSSPPELAEQLCEVLARDAASAVSQESLADTLQGIWQIGQVSFPDVHSELKLRMRPLREHWEARGPGLLAAIARRWSFCEVPAEVSVQLVHPVCGGGGDAHYGFHRITIEAVLVNPIAGLPEVVRLGWFFTQLGLARGGLSQDEQTLYRVPLLALLITLSAAEEVDLLEFKLETIDQALAAWRTANGSCPPSSEELLSAWHRYAAGNDSIQAGWDDAFRKLTQ